MKQYQFSLKDECMEELPSMESIDQKDYNLNYGNNRAAFTDYQIQYADHVASLQSIPVPKEFLNQFEDGKVYSEDGLIIFDSNKYFYGKCERCGWEGSSDKMSGGGQIADTGDYDDVACPVCFSTSMLDSEFDTGYLGTIAIPKQKVDDTELWKDIFLFMESHIKDMNYLEQMKELQKHYTITRK